MKGLSFTFKECIIFKYAKPGPAYNLPDLNPLFLHERETDTDTIQAISPTGLTASSANATTYNLLTLEVGTPLEEVQINERQLHGKFFQDRAWFYVVEKPELYISNTEVTELTLYFIDGVLCKKKYLLTEDISSALMKSYGGFKFKSLNHRTRDITKKEKIVMKTAKGNQLNEKLERFEMKWDADETLIRYHLSKDSLQSTIFLEEELSSYKYLLADAGKGTI